MEKGIPYKQTPPEPKNHLIGKKYYSISVSLRIFLEKFMVLFMIELNTVNIRRLNL